MSLQAFSFSPLIGNNTKKTNKKVYKCTY